MTLPDEMQDGGDARELGPFEFSEDNEILFQENAGLYTAADLQVVGGTSPVLFDLYEGRGRLSITLSGGTVSAYMDSDRCEELGRALLDAAERLRTEGSE